MMPGFVSGLSFHQACFTGLLSFSWSLDHKDQCLWQENDLDADVGSFLKDSVIEGIMSRPSLCIQTDVSSLRKEKKAVRKDASYSQIVLLLRFQRSCFYLFLLPGT